MSCRHYAYSEFCSLCVREVLRRYQKALEEIAERIKTTDELTPDLVEAINRITRAALKK